MKKITTRKFDEAFERGEDVTKHLDLPSASRPNQTIRRVNVDFPEWVIQGLDLEADRLGVSRQALVKIWVAERLERLKPVK